jgi:hypothetical protein
VRIAINATLVRVVAYHSVVEPIQAVVFHGLLEFWTEEEVARAHVFPIGAWLGSRAFTNTSGLALSATFAGGIPINTASLGIV